MNVLVAAAGNRLAGDDAAGLLLLDRLSATLGDRVRLAAFDGDPIALVEALAGAEVAYVFDAAKSGRAPGTILRFDASRAAVPAGTLARSTHALGVGDAIELARSLGRLPVLTVVFAIEGADFSTGAALSSPVMAAVERAAQSVGAEIEASLRASAARMERHA